MQLYARFRADYDDMEYSFVGTIEGAIEWTDMYSHWDGCEFTIEHGILTGEYESYNGDAEDYPDDLEDFCHVEYKDIKFCGLFYYGPDGKPRIYKGTVIRVRETESPSAEE